MRSTSALIQGVQAVRPARSLQLLRSFHASPLSSATDRSSKGSPNKSNPQRPPPSSSSSPSPSSGGHGVPSPSVSTPPPSSGTQQPISQLYRYTTRTSLPPSLSLSDLTRPGGRQSVSGVVATVFGSSGFLGRYAVNHLGRIGSQVIVPYRGDGMSSRHLRLNGDLGQIVPVPFSLYDASSITKAVQQSNIVINCIGSRYETANYKYDDVNAKSPTGSPSCPRRPAWTGSSRCRASARRSTRTPSTSAASGRASRR